MHKQIYQKVLFHLSLSGIVMSILVGFYDVIFGYLLEATHLILEAIEMGLDKLIEHIFETEVHETQIIVFYIMLLIGGLLIYLIYKTLRMFWDSVSHGFYEDWSGFKDAITTDWRSMSMTNRIIWVSVFILANYLASFLLF
jgi:hypothetical protein